MNQISYDSPPRYDAIVEAICRQQQDGIPRHVYADGRIMKWDWVLVDGQQG